MTHISLVPLKGQIYCPPGCIVKVQGVGDIQCEHALQSSCEHALQSSCEHGLQSSCEHGLQSSCGICFVWCLDMPDRQTIVLSFNYMYSVYTSRQLSVQSCMICCRISCICIQAIVGQTHTKICMYIQFAANSMMFALGLYSTHTLNCWMLLSNQIFELL